MVVRRPFEGKLFGLPYLSVVPPSDSIVVPKGRGVLFDENGGMHEVNNGIFKKIALMEDGLFIPNSREYEETGANFGSATLPMSFNGKDSVHRFLLGEVKKAGFIQIESMPRILSLRFLRHKLDEAKFLFGNKDIYLKPSYACAGFGIVRLRFDEDNTLHAISSKEVPFVQAAVDKLGWKKMGTGNSHYEEACKTHAGVIDILNFMVKVYAHLLRETMGWAPIVAESALKTEKYDGMNVDFRFIAMDRGNGFEWMADYAKVGNPFVSNISMGGHGEKTEAAVKAMLASCEPDADALSDAYLQKSAAGLVKSMGEIAIRISNGYTKLCKEINNYGKPPYYPPHLLNPKLFGIDFALVKEGKELVPHLIEMSAGNVGMSGLEATNPQKYGIVTDSFANLVQEEYYKFAKK